MKAKFPYIASAKSSDSGICCFQMIAYFYGIEDSENIYKDYLRDKSNIKFSLNELDKLSSTYGLHVHVNKIQIQDIAALAKPIILLSGNDNYIIIYKVKGNKIFIADPNVGKLQLKKEEMLYRYQIDNVDIESIILTPIKGSNKSIATNKYSILIQNILKYLSGNKMYVLAIIISYILTSVLQLVFPFLMEIIVDIGLAQKDLHLIIIILLCQFTFAFGKIASDFIRDWILIHFSTRIAFLNLFDFIKKLLGLSPVLFSNQFIGDIVQRIQDHIQVDHFISRTLISSISASISIIVFGIALALYDIRLILVFLVLATIEIIWILFFLKKMEVIDNDRFSLSAENQHRIHEMILGIQDIQIYDLNDRVKNLWAKVQLASLNNKIESLKLHQIENSGSFFIQNIRWLFILLISAMAILNNSMSVGQLLAVTFILGQLERPISELINLIIDGQRAALSLKRLSDIHQTPTKKSINHSKKFESGDISAKGLKFSYDGNIDVLKDVNFNIEKGKMTAIVGVSGSGKSTLIKLLLKLIEPEDNMLFVNEQDINNIDKTKLRSNCASVSLESFLFSDSLLYNVSLSENPDLDLFESALKMANVFEEVQQLPYKHETKIGRGGLEVSQGQKQRILLARALYRNPEYLFLDEATNSLDSENEKMVMDNIMNHLNGKTLVVVAHRLTTVIDADKILVLKDGKIVEKGNHRSLTQLKGEYYSIISNQLELV